MIIDIKLSTTKPLAWVIMLKQNQNSMTIKLKYKNHLSPSSLS